MSRICCSSLPTFICIFFLINIVLGDIPFFRKDYVFNSSTQNFYKVHTVMRPWADARTRCQLEGASLFVPDSKLDYDTALALMRVKLPIYGWVWTGIHDLLSEGEFQSVDGVPLDEIYHEWAYGEPNNSNDEDCVILRTSDNKFNDDKCQSLYPFICKKTRASVEWNVLCDMADPTYLYNRELGKCYKLHLTAKNWMEAFSVCTAEQSYLAVINSKAESEHFAKMIADAPKDRIKGPHLDGFVHLGFHNRFNEGFITVQGVKLEESGFYTWGEGQPDNAGNTEQCGSMVYAGGLNDITCTVTCIFMCEHDIGQLSSALDDRIKEKEPKNVV